MKPSRIPKINTPRSASSSKVDSTAKFSEQLESLEGKMQELDELINKKVGQAFLRRGTLQKKKAKEQRRVSGYFDSIQLQNENKSAPTANASPVI